MELVEQLVQAALDEDVGREDITTNTTVPADSRCEVRVVAKETGYISGMEPFRTAFDLLQADIQGWGAFEDGQAANKGDLIVEFSGKTRAVLTAERTAMNFLQHLSGIATFTSKFVAQVEGFKCRICDTRKTTPGMRVLEKAAVKHGGGYNHRHALFDGILIKENHIMAAGGLRTAVTAAVEKTHHLMRICVEVTNLEELDEAIDAGAQAILLDNMDYDTMREAVNRGKDKGIILEASGNATLDRVHDMAATGVQVISVGALTHSAPAFDCSLLIETL